MSDVCSQFDPADIVCTDELASSRARAGIDIRFSHAYGRSYASDYLEYGGFRVRTPRHRSDAEAVLINTAGGIAGGDRINLSVAVDPGARATMTSQAGERIYKSLGAPSRMDVRMTLARDSELHWLPHETILYDRSAYLRNIDVAMDASAHLLISEMIVFGRRAMDERIASGSLSDQWRIRRNGKLVFAEASRLKGDMSAMLGNAATGGGAHVSGLLLYVAPGSEAALARLRDTLANHDVYAGASSWNELVCARLAGSSTRLLKNAMAAAIQSITGKPMPRVWNS